MNLIYGFIPSSDKMQIYKKRKDYEKWLPVSVFVFRNEVEFVFSFVSIENNLPAKFFQIFS
jgi:hypothetical protein